MVLPKRHWWVPAGSFLLGLLLSVVAGPKATVFGARAPAAGTMGTCELVVQDLKAAATATGWRADGAPNGGQLKVDGSYTLLGNTFNTIEQITLDLRFHLKLADASGATVPPRTCEGDAFATIASNANAFLFNPDPSEVISEVRTVEISANGDALLKAISDAAAKLNSSDPDCDFGVFDLKNQSNLIDKSANEVFARLTVTVSGRLNDGFFTPCGPDSEAVEGKVKFDDDGNTKRPNPLKPVK